MKKLKYNIIKLTTLYRIKEKLSDDSSFPPVGTIVSFEKVVLVSRCLCFPPPTSKVRHRCISLKLYSSGHIPIYVSSDELYKETVIEPLKKRKSRGPQILIDDR